MTPSPHSVTASTVDFDSASEGSNPSGAANLSEIISEIRALGWLFNNCYQVDATLWRVNLRKPDGEGDWFTNWAEAPTLHEALEDCMSKLADAEFTESPPITFAKAPEAEARSAGSLISQLGLALRPSSPPIKRRV